MVNSGKYRHYVEVMERVETGEVDKLGEKKTEWKVKKGFFAEFVNRTGNMMYGRAGDSKLANTTHKISYRYDNCPWLDETYLLRIAGCWYAIEYVDNLDNRCETMEVFISRDNLRGR